MVDHRRGRHPAGPRGADVPRVLAKQQRYRHPERSGHVVQSRAQRSAPPQPARVGMRFGRRRDLRRRARSGAPAGSPLPIAARRAWSTADDVILQHLAEPEHESVVRSGTSTFVQYLPTGMSAAASDDRRLLDRLHGPAQAPCRRSRQPAPSPGKSSIARRNHPMTVLKRSLAHRSRGFTLVEVLVALVVLSIGLLGVAALQLTSLRSNHSSAMRSQATFLAYDIIDRMRANRDCGAGRPLRHRPRRSGYGRHGGRRRPRRLETEHCQNTSGHRQRRRAPSPPTVPSCGTAKSSR